MRQGALQLVIGLAIGVGTAALLVGMIGAQALQNFLFRVNPRDVLFVYCATAGVLSAVAAASVFVPARRATRVNPMVALRTE